MLGKFLGALVGVIGALWLGIAGAAGMYWWENEPARPAWTQAHFLFLRWPHWLRDPSPAAQAAALKTDFATERRSFDIVDGALIDQNGRVEAWGLLGSTALAKSAAPVDAYASSLAVVSKRKATNAAAIIGSDECARVLSADKHFLEALAQ